MTFLITDPYSPLITFDHLLPELLKNKFNEINYERRFRYKDTYKYLLDLISNTEIPNELVLEESKLKKLADVLSRKAMYVETLVPDNIAEHAITSIASRLYIDKPKADTRGILARYKNPQWWIKNIRKSQSRLFEINALQLNRINSKRCKYVSDEAVYRWRNQQARNRGFKESTTAVNELGQEFTLQQLSDRSVSAPYIRRSELMVRLRGFEEIADTSKDVGILCTITCPSRMHSCISETGARNTKYDGTTPKQAQNYLCKQMAKARAKLKRNGINVYGFRIVEPHHDGTPHWHVLLFVNPNQKHKLTEILRHYALQIDGDEPGAKKIRFEAEDIDSKRGSATSYVAKYISKNIDGHGLEADSDFCITDIERVRAWASLWGIRQFQ